MAGGALPGLHDGGLRGARAGRRAEGRGQLHLAVAVVRRQAVRVALRTDGRLFSVMKHSWKLKLRRKTSKLDLKTHGLMGFQCKRLISSVMPSEYIGSNATRIT